MRISRKKMNPFERGMPTQNNQIEVVVHTEYISESYKEVKDDVKRLIELSKLPFVSVLFLPVRNINLEFKTHLINEKAITSSYVDSSMYREEKVALKYKDVEMGILNGSLKEYGDICSRDSKVRVLDLQAISHLEPDYFVMSSNDEVFKGKRVSAKKITINELMQEIRILLVSYGLYYVRPNSTIIGEGTYYSFRVRSKFPSLIESNIKWSAIYKESPSIQPSNYGSLYQRLYLICKALDKIDFQSLKNPNNDTLDESLYHLGFMIMLVTGTFDGIAWIVKDFYNIELSKMKVSIQIPIGKQKSDLIKKLESVNQELFEYLVDKDTQTKINIIYQIRHSLQHRTFINGMGQGSSNKRESNLLFLPHETPDLFEELSNDSSIGWGLELSLKEGKLFDLNKFAHEIFNLTSEIVNNSLDLLDWETQIKELPQQQKEELDKLIEEFIQKKHPYDKIGMESMYFN